MLRVEEMPPSGREPARAAGVPADYDGPLRVAAGWWHRAPVAPAIPSAPDADDLIAVAAAVGVIR